MKKTILRVIAITAIAALFCVVCNDGGANSSAVNNGRVDDFLNEYKEKPKKDTATTPTSGGNASTYYTLTVNIYPENSGAVLRDPENAAYKAGDTVILTANAKPGFTFVNWSGMSNAATESVTLVMHSNLNLTANFNESDVIVTDTVLPVIALNTPLSHNEVIKNISFTDPGASASDGRGNILDYDTQIKNAAGQSFEAVNTSVAGTFFITYTACKTLTYPNGNKTDTCASAVREVRVVEPPEILPTYTLTTSAEPADGGAVSRNPDETTFNAGDTVTVTAETASGYTFTGWTGASLPASASVKIIMSGNLTLAANFLQQTYKLDVSAASGGYTLRNPNKTDYAAGEEVTVTARANAGHEFAGWTGAVTSQRTSITVKMDSSITLTAVFNQLTYTLAVSADPAAGGIVSRDPSKDAYAYGEEVTVTALAATGQQFSGWSGSFTSTSPTVTVKMDSSMALAAKFEAQTAGAAYTLSTVANPAGGGEITRSPDKTAYSAGEKVTVTAAAKPGYTFTGWSGASDASAASITVTMNSGLSLAANFQQQKYSLTVNVDPPDGGTVTRNDQDKTEYAYGDTVRVTDTPKTGYMFTNWTGAATGTANPATVIMTENKTLTANFALRRYRVTFDPNGGSVDPTFDSTGIDSTLASLPTPTREEGYTFIGWFTSTGTEGTAVEVDRKYTYNTTLFAYWKGIPTPTQTTFTDSRGNKEYKKVTIGSQTWMAENLNYNAIGSKCYGEDGTVELGRTISDAEVQANCDKYGRLYNWATAMDGASSSYGSPSGVQGVCPAEWHLPSRAEWNTLIMTVGGSSTAGTKLKSPDYWNSYNNVPKGTDEYGFSALPGGFGYSNGDFGYVDKYGQWWTSSEFSGTDNAFQYIVRFENETAQGNGSPKMYYLSVRCVKD
jgi:uncharacterized protein (TIGR02145 family)/uncharacterized repeat protein (TIGR02543 family)